MFFKSDRRRAAEQQARAQATPVRELSQAEALEVAGGTGQSMPTGGMNGFNSEYPGGKNRD